VLQIEFQDYLYKMFDLLTVHNLENVISSFLTIKLTSITLIIITLVSRHYKGDSIANRTYWNLNYAP